MASHSSKPGSIEAPKWIKVEPNCPVPACMVKVQQVPFKNQNQCQVAQIGQVAGPAPDQRGFDNGHGQHQQSRKRRKAKATEKKNPFDLLLPCHAGCKGDAEGHNCFMEWDPPNVDQFWQEFTKVKQEVGAEAHSSSTVTVPYQSCPSLAIDHTYSSFMDHTYSRKMMPGQEAGLSQSSSDDEVQVMIQPPRPKPAAPLIDLTMD